MTRELAFVKMEGCGNDYVVVDGGFTEAGTPPESLEPIEELAQAVSNRNFGVGADGLILVLPGKAAPVRMRMWNADGSEGKLCLNGLRCVAKFAAERSPQLGARFTVETAAGPRVVETVRVADHVVTDVEIEAGEPDFRRAALPATGEGEELWNETFRLDGRDLTGFGVSVGNPHLVLWMKDEEAVRHAHLAAIAVPAGRDPRFPDGVNVHLVAVRPGGGLLIRTWERGSGPTLACGSGAVASFAVARRLKRVAEEAEVEMAGGEVELREAPDGSLVLRGPVREVFRGVWPLL